MKHLYVVPLAVLAFGVSSCGFLTGASSYSTGEEVDYATAKTRYEEINRKKSAIVPEKITITGIDDGKPFEVRYDSISEFCYAKGVDLDGKVSEAWIYSLEDKYYDVEKKEGDADYTVTMLTAENFSTSFSLSALAPYVYLAIPYATMDNVFSGESAPSSTDEYNLAASYRSSKPGTLGLYLNKKPSSKAASMKEEENVVAEFIDYLPSHYEGLADTELKKEKVKMDFSYTVKANYPKLK